VYAKWADTYQKETGNKVNYQVAATTVATVVRITFIMSPAGIRKSLFRGYGEQNLTGAGATFPAPVYAKWADTYQKETGNKVNYQGIGSHR
jgi:phosphate transport system substrate-binding protein